MILLIESLTRLEWILLLIQEDVGSSALKHIIFLFKGLGEAMGNFKYCVKKSRYDRNL